MTMETFAERKAALERLGWKYSLEYEYRGEVGKGRQSYDLELFTSVRLPLTPRDWCRLCMREGDEYLGVETEKGTRYEDSEYVGGCCGNMSAVQDTLNGWFRDGGWVSAHEIVAIGEAMRDHDDATFDDIAPEELAKQVEEVASLEPKEGQYLPAWRKIALLYHLIKDHHKPDPPTAQHLRTDEIEGAFHLVSRLSWAFGMGDFFSRGSSTTGTTEQVQKIMRLYRFLPAFKVIHERARELAPEPIEGYAIVDLEQGEGEVAENHYGYCIYATKPETQRVLELINRAREQYEESEPRNFAESKLRLRAVRVSIDEGIEFLDEGEGPKARIKWKRRPSWLKEDVEDVEMLFEQYCQQRSRLSPREKKDEYDPTYEEARLAWSEAAQFFGEGKE